MNTQFKPETIGQFGGPRIESDRPGGAVLAALANVWAFLSRTSARRRARAALSEFDDRMLRDIGITRLEIDLMVSHGHRGRDSD